jgi:hypothetical protein
MWIIQISKTAICHKYKKKQVQFTYYLQHIEKAIQKVSQSFTLIW